MTVEDSAVSLPVPMEPWLLFHLERDLLGSDSQRRGLQSFRLSSPSQHRGKARRLWGRVLKTPAGDPTSPQSLPALVTTKTT